MVMTLGRYFRKVGMSTHPPPTENGKNENLKQL